MQEKKYSDVAAAASLDASNKNISSVLSQIQDEGPAYSETKKRDNLVQLKTEAKQKFNVPPSNDQREKDVFSTESLLEQDNFYNSLSDKKKSWVLYLVILSLTVCSMFFMYKMDDRANKIEALLIAYDEGEQGAIAAYNNESATIIQLNAELLSMKNQLLLINSNTKSENQEIENISHVVILDEIVSTLEDEIQVLNMQLDKANNDLKIQFSENEPLTVINNNIKITTSEKQMKTSWKVNLAALSNKNKVDEIVTQLKADSLKPLIDEVMINGQLIYRLSVGGFTRFSQAELFVIIAEEEYGMKGGWIKKVSNG